MTWYVELGIFAGSAELKEGESGAQTFWVVCEVRRGVGVDQGIPQWGRVQAQSYWVFQ